MIARRTGLLVVLAVTLPHGACSSSGKSEPAATREPVGLVLEAASGLPRYEAALFLPVGASDDAIVPVVATLLSTSRAACFAAGWDGRVEAQVQLRLENKRMTAIATNQPSADVACIVGKLDGQPVAIDQRLALELQLQVTPASVAPEIPRPVLPAGSAS
mgnify:CR=1 FL=1